MWQPMVLAAGVVLALSWPGPVAEAQNPPAAPQPPSGGAKPVPAPDQPAAPAPDQPAAAAPKAPAAPKKPAAAAEKVAPAKAPPPSYVNKPMDPTREKQAKAKRIQIQRILRNGTFESQQQREFEAYYNEYAFARWEDLSRTPEMAGYRKDFVNELKIAKPGAPRNWLIQRAMEFFTQLAKGNYHPAVRVNAALILGDLNEREAPSVNEMPVPLPAALPVLVELLNDPAQIDAVKVVALRGIIRHATLGIADANVRDTQVVPALLALATAKSQPGRSVEGHAWMRMLAIEALGVVGVLGDQGDPDKVPQTLIDVVADEETPVFARCSAARTLGTLRYPAGLDLDPVALAVKLGRFAVESCKAALEQEGEGKSVVAVAAPRIPAFKRSSAAGTDEDPDAAGMAEDAAEAAPRRARGPAAPQSDISTKPLRRRLKTLLQAAWEGLAGNSEVTNHKRWSPPEGGVRVETAGLSVLATAANQQASIDSVLAGLKKVMDVCDDDEAPHAELIASVQLELDELNQTLAKPATAPTPKEQAGAPAAP